MNPFASLTSAGLEQTEDRLGGFSPLETDIYVGVIKMAYAGKADSGASSVTVMVDLPGGKEYRETVYVTNKKGENFFLNQNDQSKKVPLPGFTTIDDICLIADGKPLAETAIEEKVINMYDKDAGRELPKKAHVLVDLLGKPVALGILCKKEYKSVKNATTGAYEPTSETRELNTIDKVFHPELKITVAEARNNVTNPVFWDSWTTRNKGVTRDATAPKKGAVAKPGMPASSSAGAPPARTSLFGKK